MPDATTIDAFTFIAMLALGCVSIAAAFWGNPAESGTEEEGRK